MENGKNTDKQGKTGGLYAKVKMSVKTANIMVSVFIVLLVAATVFIVKHNGFTVKFDTNGGSYIESVKVMHSQTVDIKEEPVKDISTPPTFVFTGSCGFTSLLVSDISTPPTTVVTL